jgi:sugar/nucleoside kinase (ribokinase family)
VLQRSTSSLRQKRCSSRYLSSSRSDYKPVSQSARSSSGAFPASCTKEQREDFLSACTHVDVFSPNHLELCSLFEDHAAEGFDRDIIERHTTLFSHACACIVVVRAAEHGSPTIEHSNNTVKWLPPFYALDSSEVVDATGAGNAFLGGFMAGWTLKQDAVEASVYGNVAASFAVEQSGLPSLQAVGEQEMWNGVRVVNRLAGYRTRLESLQR